jgi:hypothetical protein
MMMSNQDRAKGQGQGKDGQGKDNEKDWQDLARLASQEKDPERLMELIRQLNSALENDGKDKDGEHNPQVPGPANLPQSGSANGKLAEVA